MHNVGCVNVVVVRRETTARVILLRMPPFDALNIEKHAQYIANYRVFMCDLVAKMSKVRVGFQSGRIFSCILLIDVFASFETFPVSKQFISYHCFLGFWDIFLDSLLMFVVYLSGFVQKKVEQSNMSCFMTMIDYYLLEARVSFCVCKNSCHVVQKLPCCLSGSSLSSDIACTSDMHCLCTMLK